MKRYEVIVIGAGPAGLSAAIEAATNGMRVIVFDENARPGGQLFKQIHKFFGSKEHKAKERGFRIGEGLLKEAQKLGVEVVLEAVVIGIFNKSISVMKGDEIKHFSANHIIIATGASENMIPFSGWTKPGVIGAGAAQTMMNLYGVRPGEKVLMVGSGNVGLVVGYQLIQAGCRLEAIVDASPTIGGYGVHAAKLTRMGVPIYTSHTIKEAVGKEHVESATMIEVDSNWQQVSGTEKTIEVDTICMAVGLSPMYQLAKSAGCEIEDSRAKGGIVPKSNEFGETSVPGIYVAGDVSGIEEASSAMIEGKIAGLRASFVEKYIDAEQFNQRFAEYSHSLSQLREGMFGHGKNKNEIATTEEGIEISKKLLAKGYLDDQEIERFPGANTKTKKGLVPVIECTQNIPCNPCQNVCVRGCIQVGETITNLPVINGSVDCTGCSLCVASCPGQAIFLVDETYAPGFAAVSMPYEIYPTPTEGDMGIALDRQGEILGNAEVIKVTKLKAMDQTVVLTIKVPVEWSMKARFFTRNDDKTERKETIDGK